jgi:hypothetical protein
MSFIYKIKKKCLKFCSEFLLMNIVAIVSLVTMESVIMRISTIGK